jgi:hypothetical protein
MEPDAQAFEQGCEAAWSDLQAGRLIYRWTGHAGPWGHEFFALVFERFGMSVEGFGVCFTTPSASAFNEGYNQVVIREIDRRHGPGAFQAVIADAKKQAEGRHSELRAEWLERQSHALPGTAD